MEPIFEHYKLFAVMPDGERLIITEQDEFTRIYAGIGLHLHADISTQMISVETFFRIDLETQRNQ